MPYVRGSKELRLCGPRFFPNGGLWSRHLFFHYLLWVNGFDERCKGREWPWSAADCAQAYEAYAEKKFHKQGLSLPQELDVMLMSYVAEKYRVVGEMDKFRCWSQQAFLESAGRPDWQEHIREVQAEGKEVDLNVIWRPN